jgi:hypothetical protein
MGNAERAKPDHRDSDDRAGLYRASEVVPGDHDTNLGTDAGVRPGRMCTSRPPSAHTVFLH